MLLMLRTRTRQGTNSSKKCIQFNWHCVESLVSSATLRGKEHFHLGHKAPGGCEVGKFACKMQFFLSFFE